METPEKRRDADRSRGAILDAAEELFAEQGFDAVTLAQIGAAAGVSRGTPGYFFGTKEALYRVVMERAAATLRMFAETLRLRDVSGQRSRDAVTSETVDAFLGLLLARRSVVRLLDRDSGMVEGQPHADALASALTALGDDAPRAALTILSLCWFPLSQPAAARALGVDPDAPTFIAQWRPHILAALGASGSAPPSQPPVTTASTTPVPAPTPPAAPTPAPPPDPAPTRAAPASSEAPDIDDGGRKKKKKGKKKKKNA